MARRDGIAGGHELPVEARECLMEAYRLAGDGQLGAAAQQCQRALALVPNWVEADRLYNRVLDGMGLGRKAAEVHTRATSPNAFSFDVRREGQAVGAGKRAPGVEEVLDAAWAALDEKSPGKAMRLCERVLRVDPDWGEAYHLSGCILEALGHHEAAANAFSTARRLNAATQGVSRRPAEAGAIGVEGETFSELVTIRTFSFESEAYVASGRLDADGIPAVVVQGEIVAMNWLFSNMVHGAKLCVREEDVKRALDALEPAVDAARPAMRCPTCGSGSVRYEKYNLRWVYAIILLFRIPLPIRKERWMCRECGMSWKEKEVRSARDAT
jgi:tetratricopeptide (TPR) repeat protein